MTSLSGRNWHLSSLIELSAATLFFSVSGLQLYGQSLADSKAATYAATRIENRITIDGDLSERDWKEAPKIANLTQRQPNPGETPSEKTEVTLLGTTTEPTSGSLLLSRYLPASSYNQESTRIIDTDLISLRLENAGPPSPSAEAWGISGLARPNRSPRHSPTSSLQSSISLWPPTRPSLTCQKAISSRGFSPPISTIQCRPFSPSPI